MPARRKVACQATSLSYRGVLPRLIGRPVRKRTERLIGTAWSEFPAALTIPALLLAFSSDGSCLAATHTDQTIRAYDPVSGRPLVVMKGPPARVCDIVFAPNSKRLIAIDEQGLVTTWNVDTGKQESSCALATEGTGAKAFSPDGQVLAAASGGPIVLWDWEHRIVTRKLPGHERQTRCLAFSANGQALFSGGEDNKVRRWDWPMDAAESSWNTPRRSPAWRCRLAATCSLCVAAARPCRSGT